VLELTQEQAASLVAHAQEAFPNECCGLLAGRQGRVKRIFRGTNVDKSPYTYLMDPKEQLAAFKEMEAAGLDLLAIYHSHTHTAAYPSKTDVAKAYYPDAIHVIVSLRDEGQPAIKGYRIMDGQIADVKVTVR
jgi:proteasome lid subunit RPN8/RPN11